MVRFYGEVIFLVELWAALHLLMISFFIAIQLEYFAVLNKKNGRELFAFENKQSSQQMYNALLSGVTIYKDKIFLPFGTGVGFLNQPYGPGGIIAFKNNAKHL